MNLELIGSIKFSLTNVLLPQRPFFHSPARDQHAKIFFRLSEWIFQIKSSAEIGQVVAGLHGYERVTLVQKLLNEVLPWRIGVDKNHERVRLRERIRHVIVDSMVVTSIMNRKMFQIRNFNVTVETKIST